jgi:hypothetical protein
MSIEHHASDQDSPRLSEASKRLLTTIAVTVSLILGAQGWDSLSRAQIAQDAFLDQWRKALAAHDKKEAKRKQSEDLYEIIERSKNLDTLDRWHFLVNLKQEIRPYFSTITREYFSTWLTDIYLSHDKENHSLQLVYMQKKWVIPLIYIEAEFPNTKSPSQ